jgi:O-acetyl-ADP-ribose deacetylase (regulator of RNase III)
MKVIKGNLIKLAAHNAMFDVIVHGCNCFHTMGAGIAKQIKKTFPEAYRADLSTIYGVRFKLGQYSSATVRLFNDKYLTIVNAYTQYYFKWNPEQPKRLVDYNAVRSCMKAIKKDFSGKKIGIPKIGAGLAGGDWKIISKIIDEELEGEDVTLVEYKN